MPADPSSGPAGKTPKTPERSAGSHQRSAAAHPARAAVTSAVEVRRSTRRRKSVTAYREGDRTIVLIPARMSQAEERRWVGVMLDKLAAQESKRHLGDTELGERATRLSAQYFDGRARPASVRWVTNQNTRWGSCTPAEGSIRLSHRLQGMPEYVVDYVLLHELAHLLVPGHGPDFWQLLEAYPRTERARGFLEGVVAAEGLPRLPAAREE
ncbi:M48 family metallopeptidase [Streptomyces sp. CAI-121]|uniref:M48 metallopeptidase family protein n=1 Tax=unclassified Streptomyces TaxID=2593676 RepID=UPI001587901F|nr:MULTISPECIES: M48 family metallopeptidase [unclassified Streptomyces]NUV66262.1 M48 family metallopeptidase [Streptomyces sp. CAI-121]NUW12056.1 M48 family metallopeptidase [Streptomyces sp. CAI-68]